MTQQISNDDIAEAGAESVPSVGYGWSAGRLKSRPEDKQRMAENFVEHDLMVPPGCDPETSPRLTAASILVNNGTTPNSVVDEATKWCLRNWDSRGPFSIIWYTPGTLVPATLRRFKEQHYSCLSAANLSLFPGQVDNEIESVLGEVPVHFARTSLKTRFTYAILSAYAFDMTTGYTYFHFSTEVALQKACAELYAGQKFLFLDPSKLESIEGEQGYSLRDLLASSQAVTIYTVESELTDRFIRQFNALSELLLNKDQHTQVPPQGRGTRPDGNGRVSGSSQASVEIATRKKMRLCIVRENAPANTLIHEGTLKPESFKSD